MADRSIKMSELKSILGRYGVRYSAKRGKGSHLLFYRVMDGGTFTYPVPTHNKDVNVAYVRGCRKKFRLRDEDGVTDKEFYGANCAAVTTMPGLNALA